MFEDLISDIESEISYLESDEEVLLYLARVRKTLGAMKEEMKGLLDDINELTVLGTEVEAGNLVNRLIELMLTNAQAAIEKTKEFDLPQFTVGLYEAIRDTQTYTILPAKQGFAIIKVNLDITAGTLDDYAKAVNTARQNLTDKQGNAGIGPFRGRTMSAEMASEMWKNKYYRPAREGRAIPQPKRDPSKKKKKARKYNVEAYKLKYFETIRQRIAAFSGKAPWWRILNYGVAGLSSDWGGTGYPTSSPTHFVENSIKELQAQLTDEEARAGTTSTHYALVLLDTELDKVNAAINFTFEQEERISFAVAASIENPKTKKEYTVVQVRQALGEKFTQADIFRVTQLVNDLAEGRIDPEHRVELTKSGTGIRIRKRVKALYNLIQQFEAED